MHSGSWTDQHYAQVILDGQNMCTEWTCMRKIQKMNLESNKAKTLLSKKDLTQME